MKDTVNLLLVAVVAAAVGIAGNRIDRHLAGDACDGCHCGRPPHRQPHVDPWNPAPPVRPAGSPYRLSPDGEWYWRYDGDRVIGRWHPYTGVYEAWDGRQWVKGTPPVGDLPPKPEK